MLSISFLQFFLASLAFVPNICANRRHGGTHDPVLRTKLALESLQKWYNTDTGLWEPTGWWNGANIMTMIGDFAKAAPSDEELQELASNIFTTTLLNAPIKNPQPGIEYPPSNTTNVETGYIEFFDPHTDVIHVTYPSNWHNKTWRSIDPRTASGHDSNYAPHRTTPDIRDWLDGFYDDDLWWALAWLNAYDVTYEAKYLELAEGIFLAVSRTWGTHCSNGGLYWNWEKAYVNAITNELFFSTAAHLANRAQSNKKRAIYLAWAEKSLGWFLESGMINWDTNTINDGLTEDCKNNNRTAWSYNQGVILGGLVELDRTGSDVGAPQLATAHGLALGALAALSDENQIIHDACEPDCGADGAQFKGIFMRNLVKLRGSALDHVFSDAIRKNAESIWFWNRGTTPDGLPVFSVNWAGPWVSPANVSTHSSAMDALVAAIIVSGE